MHRHSSNSSKRRYLTRFLTVLAVGLFVAGGYLLLLILTPAVPALNPVRQIDAKQLPTPKTDTVYIPKIGVEVPLGSSGPEALNEGAWHRFPERGDPIKGGNFIVSAHRFELGLTPGQTARKSPFYHIEKLAVGDQVLIDFSGKRYGYEITEKKSVAPTQTDIEASLNPDEPARLTLYTCTLGGESDGREVFFGKLLGEVKNGLVERP